MSNGAGRLERLQRTLHELELEASRPVTRFDIAVEPAVRLAESGFVVPAQLAANVPVDAVQLHVDDPARLASLRKQLPARVRVFGVMQVQDRSGAPDAVTPLTARP